MIINLTQHQATADQVAVGVVNLPEFLRADLIEALTFTSLPDMEELEARADFISELACQNGLGPDDMDDPFIRRAMIGGAPYLMGYLVSALRAKGIEALYSFTQRETVETVNPDGSITKTAVFRHQGWVPA